jgi:hypothetical protein
VGKISVMHTASGVPMRSLATACISDEKRSGNRAQAVPGFCELSFASDRKFFIIEYELTER